MSEEEQKKRSAKAQRTRRSNLAAKEHAEAELTKARSTARNAQRALKEFKKGMEAGIKLVTDAMRANN